MSKERSFDCSLACDECEHYNVTCSGCYVMKESTFSITRADFFSG